MNAQSKTYKVTIFGEQYTFMSDESEQHVAFVAHIVDSTMQEIAQKMPRIPSSKIAVLVALQLASKFTHEQENNKRSLSSCTQLAQNIAACLHE